MGEHIYIATDQPGMLRPSNLSRALIRETLHLFESHELTGGLAQMFEGHSRLDTEARRLNVKFGFGQCDAVGGFPACSK